MNDTKQRVGLLTKGIEQTVPARAHEQALAALAQKHSQEKDHYLLEFEKYKRATVEREQVC